MEEARRIVRLEQDAKMDFNSYGNVLERLRDACCDLRAKSNSSSSSVEEGLIISHDEFRALQNMLSTHYDRVGMEQSTVCSLFSDRLVRHKRHVEAVLYKQQDGKIANGCRQSSNVDYNRRAEAVASTAQEISRPARILARLLAQAHAFD